MAIYGVGSIWENDELKTRFFSEDKFIVGWNEPSAKDIYSSVSSLKVGDILYIKSASPGSRKIRVKGVGIVVKNFMNCINEDQYGGGSFASWESLFLKVKWIHREEFFINIPVTEGKLTNFRASTIYEEFLPFVQEKILEKILDPIYA